MAKDRRSTARPTSGAKARLAEYRAKRDFSKTPEPTDEPAKAPRAAAPHRGAYVVQKHDATRLHYDLRLEVAGAMMSWAVPKGPSFDPKVKRLAVETEDHPMAYNAFEGRIPDGEYGAGDVLIWDQGTFETIPPGQEEAMRAKGHFHVRIFGEKLHGGWHVVRTGGRKTSGDDRGKPQWLFFKAEDGTADKTYDVVAERPESVVSGRSATRGPRRVGASPSGQSAQALHDAMGEPCKAVLAEKIHDPSAYLFEIKYDGYRLVSVKAGADVKVFTRNGHDWTARFPELVRALTALPAREVVVEGEVCAVNAEGSPSFGRLQQWLAGDKRDALLAYPLFDLLWLDGRDLRDLPIEERRQLLQGLAGKAPPPLSVTTAVEGNLPDLLAAARTAGLEGLLAKRKGSPYRSGASGDWLKLKLERRQDCVLVGYVPLKGNDKVVGALLLAVVVDGALTFVGRVGTGFDDRTRGALARRLDDLAVPRAPVKVGPEEKGVRWVRPELVAEVGFTQWSDDQRLRHPRFLGLREDKTAAECLKEEAAPVPRDTVSPRRRPPPKGRTEKAGTTPAPAPAAPGTAKVRITNPDKILYPRDGITKREIAAYYAAVAPTMLRHLAGRPLTIQRWPDGIDGEEWYQQNTPPNVPAFVRTVPTPQEDDKRHHGHRRRMVCDNLDTLLYLANLAALTLHQWPSHAPPAPADDAKVQKALDQPDYVVIDLDPGDGTFDDLVEVAHAVRTLVEALDLPSVVKTTGKRGLHIVLPIEPGPSHDDVVAFGAEVARAVAKVLPNIATAERMKAKRGGRLYVDAGQNGAGRTIVAPYSLRALDGAPVSTPLRWSEVTKGLVPRAFGPRAVLDRLEKHGDLFAGALATRGGTRGRLPVTRRR